MKDPTDPGVMDRQGQSPQGIGLNETDPCLSCRFNTVNSVVASLAYHSGFPDPWVRSGLNPWLPELAGQPPHWRGDQSLFVEDICGRWSDPEGRP